jgi:hypothetical protein
LPYVISRGRAPDERDDPRADRRLGPYETSYRILRGYPVVSEESRADDDSAAFQARPASRRRR